MKNIDKENCLVGFHSPECNVDHLGEHCLRGGLVNWALAIINII